MYNMMRRQNVTQLKPENNEKAKMRLKKWNKRPHEAKKKNLK